jgi:DUF1680 family protein
LPEYLYTLTKDTLSCDIYAPSVLAWETSRQVITVKQDGGLPHDGRVALRFEMAEPQEFTLRVRIPRYATASVPVLVNGQELVVGQPGSYVVLYRQWRNGDQLNLTIPLGFGVHPYQGDNAVEGFDRCAYTYGPLLMAVVGPRNHDKGIVLPGPAATLPARLKPGTTPLGFAIDGCPEHLVRPYYELQTEVFSCFPMFASEKKTQA